MSSIFNEALEQALNPQMPPPKSPPKTPISPSRTSTLFQDKIMETVVTVPGPSTAPKPRPSTHRRLPIDKHDVYASGALPPLSVSPTQASQGLPEEIPIPKFTAPSHLSYVSNYPEDDVDSSEPTPSLPPPQEPTPCRNFRDPHTATEEERQRHFVQHQQRRLGKLVSARDVLRDTPALTSTRTENTEEGLRKFGSTKGGMVPFYRGSAGEDVYVPSAWRSQSKASADQDDIFSDVAEDGDSDDDGNDEREWDMEFAKAEEVVKVESRAENEYVWEEGCQVGNDNMSLRSWPNEMAQTKVQLSHGPAMEKIAEPAWKRYRGAAEGKTAATSALPSPASTDPAIEPYVKRTPPTTSWDWAHPVTGAPSPTESQLVTSGFEFHDQLSEEEQIARFGDNAFRKALREVLPSLSRKQQWHAWRRVNEEVGGDGDGEDMKIGARLAANLRKEAKDESGVCECKCLGDGEECGGEDGTYEKFLGECLCRESEDCDEHYRWHYAERTCASEEESGDQPKGWQMLKCVCGEWRHEGGDGQTEPHEHATSARTKHTMPKKGTGEESDTFVSVCGCGADETNCRSLPDRRTGEHCSRIEARHHGPALNLEIADRPSDWTASFPQGRLIDGKLTSSGRGVLDVGHDVPTPSVVRIPGLDLLDQQSDPQSTQDAVRRSVEAETPRRQLHRESTPAFEDRSLTPSPASQMGKLEDVEMTDAPSTNTFAPPNLRPGLSQTTSSPGPVSTATQTPTRQRSESRSRSLSPAKAPVQPPDPLASTPKSTKRASRRKSAVQGAKVEKTCTGKSRAVSRKVTAAVKGAAEKAGNKVKEAVARIEASVKEQEEGTPRRSARIRAKVENE